MKSIINELWQGNIILQEDSRTNSKEMKKLFGYKKIQGVTQICVANCVIPLQKLRNRE